MAEINEEFISEYARVIGNAHAAINQGVGDENTPGSAIFELNQLKYLAEKKQPAFGIIQNGSTTGFNVTVDPDDSNFIKVSSGQIAYFNNTLNVPAQRISIVKTFASTYLSTDVYGIRIGFPVDEAIKSTTEIYASVLKENFVHNTSNIIYIDNPQRIINLGFPITAYLGLNTYVVFDKATDDGKGLYIDSAINISQSFDSGTSINFIYEPKIKALFGLPVDVASHDPDEFLYYPPLPSDWIHIADLLVLNPNSPAVDTFGILPAISRKALDYPSSSTTPALFSRSDSQQIIRYVNAAISELSSNKDRSSVGDSITALEYYTSALQENTSQTFREFWAARPLKVSTYFGKGLNYEGLERFEFSENFCDAYFELKGTDLNRTFAMFRGDLYSNPSNIYGSPPSSLTLNSYNNFKGLTSTLGNGTYYYGVSAVLTTGETRETPTTVSSVITSPGASNYLNAIQWTPVTNAQFYHIYRKSTQSGEQIEYRLSNVNSIKGAGPITNPSITPNTTVNISTSGIAFKITPTGASEMHLGGLNVKLKATDTTITNLSDYVTVELYSNNSGTGKPNAVISTATFENVTYENVLRNNSGVLSDSFKDVYLKTNYKLLSGSSYWFVLKLNTPPSSGNIQLHVSNSSASALYATYAGTTWALINNITPYYKMLGFIDNGIKGTAAASKGLYLSGKITKEPRRLRIYLPNIESFPYSGPIIGPYANTTEAAITKNEMIVTITAQNGTDDPIVLPAITIPQSTPSDTEFLVGTADQIFDIVLNVQVIPGVDVTTGALNSILWSKYDTFVVENVP
jgi:hypothetical protein